MFIPIVSKFTAVLGEIWLLLIMLEMISPSKHTILNHGGKLQALCLYGSNWTKEEENRKCFLRIFVQDGKKWKKSGETLYLKGFDSSLLGHGFFLIKLPYAEWRVLGNGYDTVLGQKVANHVFISASKKKDITFLHNGTLVSKHFEKYEKFDYVRLDWEQLKLVSLADDFAVSSFLKRVLQYKGTYILLQNKGYFSLYKVFNGLVYTVIVDRFQIESECPCFRLRHFERDGDFGYKLTDDLRR